MKVSPSITTRSPSRSSKGLVSWATAEGSQRTEARKMNRGSGAFMDQFRLQLAILNRIFSRQASGFRRVDAPERHRSNWTPGRLAHRSGVSAAPRGTVRDLFGARAGEHDWDGAPKDFHVEPERP